jgi:hypothetical protein
MMAAEGQSGFGLRRVQDKIIHKIRGVCASAGWERRLSVGRKSKLHSDDPHTVLLELSPSGSGLRCSDPRRVLSLMQRTVHFVSRIIADRRAKTSMNSLRLHLVETVCPKNERLARATTGA